MIYIRGPLALPILIVIAVLGFLLSLGELLDLYDALWRYTVPATLVYAALIWVFLLRPPKGEPKPVASWPLGLDIILIKAGITLAVLLATLGAVALVWDLIKLVGDNWHYIVVTLGLLAVILLFAWLWPQKKTPGAAPPKGRRKSDDIVS